MVSIAQRVSTHAYYKATNASLFLTDSGHQEVQVGTEKLRSIALEDDDLDLSVIAKSLNHISHAVLEVDAPKIDSRVWIVEGDLENAAILNCLETAVVWEIESKDGL